MLIDAKGISKSFGAKVVLDNVDILVDKGDKIALVGENGSGKSTLVKILCQKEEKDTGTLSLKRSLRIGYLNQDMALDETSTIYEEVKKGAKYVFSLAEELSLLGKKLQNEKNEEELIKLNEEYFEVFEQFEACGGYEVESRIKGVLTGFGFGKEDYDKGIASLSGGQKMRVAFGKLLMEYNDIIVLDEPTNYLDAMGVEFLENYLFAYKNSVIVISHDRYFLDKFATKVAYLKNHHLRIYTGNYTAFVQKYKAESENYKKAYALQQKEIQRQEDIIKTLKSFNREKSIRAAESREKLLGKMDRLERPEEKKSIRLSFDFAKIISQNSCDIYDLCVGYEDKIVAKGLNATFGARDKIAIIGPNGSGKSTLLKTLSAKIPPISGEFKFSPGVRINYFEQIDDFESMENTVIDEVMNYCRWDIYKVRSLLAAMLFTKDDISKKINVLSGGEKARVKIAKLMTKKSNVLFLDEPTNHLDIESKEIVEDALEAYAGLIVAVSHDRYFLSKLFNRVILVDSGSFAVYDEPFDINMMKREDTNKNSSEDKNQQGEKKETATLSKNQVMRLKNEVSSLEEEIEKYEKRKNEINGMLLKEEIYSDSGKLSQLSAELKDIEKQQKEAEARWIEINEILSSM